jgi:hypothetical protein
MFLKILLKLIKRPLTNLLKSRRRPLKGLLKVFKGPLKNLFNALLKVLRALKKLFQGAWRPFTGPWGRGLSRTKEKPLIRGSHQDNTYKCSFFCIF